MRIARSTYYDKPAISVDDTALVETMASISDSFEAYGYRRMQASLIKQCVNISEKVVLVDDNYLGRSTTTILAGP